MPRRLFAALSEWDRMLHSVAYVPHHRSNILIPSHSYLVASREHPPAQNTDRLLLYPSGHLEAAALCFFNTQDMFYRNYDELIRATEAFVTQLDQLKETSEPSAKDEEMEEDTPNRLHALKRLAKLFLREIRANGRLGTANPEEGQKLAMRAYSNFVQSLEAGKALGQTHAYAQIDEAGREANIAARVDATVFAMQKIMFMRRIINAGLRLEVFERRTEEAVRVLSLFTETEHTNGIIVVNPINGANPSNAEHRDRLDYMRGFTRKDEAESLYNQNLDKLKIICCDLEKAKILLIQVVDGLTPADYQRCHPQVEALLMNIHEMESRTPEDLWRAVDSDQLHTQAEQLVQKIQSLVMQMDMVHRVAQVSGNSSMASGPTNNNNRR